MSAPRPRNVPRELDELRHMILTMQRQATTFMGGVSPAPHASTHSDGGSDPVDILDLAGYPEGSPDPATLFLRGDREWVESGSYTDEQAQDAVGTILTDTDSIDFTYTDATPSITAAVKVAHRTRHVTFTFDGQGSVLTTGKTIYTRVPMACTITKAYLVADASGNLTVDAWKDSFASYPPTNGDSITASATPALSSAQTYEDTTLSGWTTSLSAGDWVGASIEGTPGTITWAQLVLEVVIA